MANCGRPWDRSPPPQPLAAFRLCRTSINPLTRLGARRRCCMCPAGDAPHLTRRRVVLSDPTLYKIAVNSPHRACIVPQGLGGQPSRIFVTTSIEWTMVPKLVALLSARCSGRAGDSALSIRHRPPACSARLPVRLTSTAFAPSTRTSGRLIDDAVLHALVPQSWWAAHRRSAALPDHPVIRPAPASTRFCGLPPRPLMAATPFPRRPRPRDRFKRDGRPFAALTCLSLRLSPVHYVAPPMRSVAGAAWCSGA